MLGKTFFVGGLAALLAAGTAAPAAAQAFCNGPLGSAICGAGIGGGIGAAVGGKSGAQTGAIIGGAAGLLTAQPTYRQPTYRQPTYAPPPRYTYRPSYQPTYQPAYPSDLVYRIQSGLLQLGYDPGPADGIYGRGTSSAISAYQSDNGLAVDGQPSLELYDHMAQYLN